MSNSIGRVPDHICQGGRRWILDEIRVPRRGDPVLHFDGRIYEYSGEEGGLLQRAIFREVVDSDANIPATDFRASFFAFVDDLAGKPVSQEVADRRAAIVEDRCLHTHGFSIHRLSADWWFTEYACMPSYNAWTCCKCKQTTHIEKEVAG